MTDYERNTLHRAWIDALQVPCKPLTSWELGFLASVSNQLDYGRSLTDDQASKLEEIYAEKTA